MSNAIGAARHAGDPIFFPQFENLRDERSRSAANSTVDQRACNARAMRAEDVLQLYRQLQRAPGDTEEFELLNAAFNRVCEANPEAVEIALRMEHYTA